MWYCTPQHWSPIRLPTRDMWRVNVLATRNLVAAAEKYKVRRFVQMSSIVAYGNSAEGELDEEQPVHADGGSYVLTKLASEHTVLAATPTVPWNWSLFVPEMSMDPAADPG